MRTDILERKEDILRWISENQSKAFMCRELQCKQDTLNSYLKKMGISYSGNIIKTEIILIMICPIFKFYAQIVIQYKRGTVERILNFILLNDAGVMELAYVLR